MTLEHWAKAECEDPYAKPIAKGIDLVNPLTIVKDAMDLFGIGDEDDEN